MKFTSFLREFNHEEDGQDMLEYALIVLAVLTSVSAGSEHLSKTLDHEMKHIAAEIKSLIK